MWEDSNGSISINNMCVIAWVYCIGGIAGIALIRLDEFGSKSINEVHCGGLNITIRMVKRKYDCVYFKKRRNIVYNWKAGSVRKEMKYE